MNSQKKFQPSKSTIVEVTAGLAKTTMTTIETTRIIMQIFQNTWLHEAGLTSFMKPNAPEPGFMRPRVPEHGFMKPNAPEPLIQSYRMWQFPKITHVRAITRPLFGHL